MREIKFRGLNKLGKWEYGDLVHNTINSANQIIEVGIKSPRCYAVEVLPETVGQFTGRKDKNGWDIFEGDNVAFRGDFAIPEKCGEFVATIKYSTEHCGFVLQSQKHIWLINDETDEFDCKSLVVGNIHEVNNA